MAVSAETALADRVSQERKGLAEVGPRMFPVLLAKQQLGKVVAAVAFRRHRQIGEEGLYFAAADAHGGPVAVDARRPEKVEGQPRHDFPLRPV